MSDPKVMNSLIKKTKNITTKKIMISQKVMSNREENMSSSKVMSSLSKDKKKIMSNENKVIRNTKVTSSLLNKKTISNPTQS